MFDQLSEKFSNVVRGLRGKDKISEENIDEALKSVRTALLEADVNFQVVKTFTTQVKEKALGSAVVKGVDPGEQFVKIVHDELSAVMGQTNELPAWTRPLTVILVVGLNGAGKTTFSGKLALYLRKKEREVFLVPADIYRPAAKDQLLVLARNLGIDYHDSNLQHSPEAIALAAIEEAKLKNKSVVIIDTAGRLHVDSELMEELKRLKQAIAVHSPEVILVADAMTGQEAVNVAKIFHEAITLTGITLSKMDSDARGGAALSLRFVTGVPIWFISTGEKMKDLDLFHPDRIAKRILDMGDVLTLVEKAQEVVDEQDAMKMMERMSKSRFTIDDFLKQMNMMSKMGSFGSLMKMIPGMGGLMREMGDLSPAEDELKKIKVMISSMTQKERADDALLNASRLKRIARGSGRSQKEVEEFIAKFRQMRKVIGPLMGMMSGGMPSMPGMGGMPGMPAPKGFRGHQPNFSIPQEKKKSGKKRGQWGQKYF